MVFFTARTLLELGYFPSIPARKSQTRARCSSCCPAALHHSSCKHTFLRWREDPSLICLSVNKKMGIRDVFPLSFFSLNGASNDLSTCWAFQSGFYFDLHQQGMEWSRLGLSPPEAPWTSRSLARVRRGDATALIYYSGVILRLWI